ncbi:MAG: hypothetical protein K9L98_02950 [Candidatus Pacebacteria bacterium]|nr:hypothetical protein [Candidatus Paceibacterota bacterium]MCF7862940.1 hypothetical protein [Candidatus Paceibacterota bacterium]
MEQLIEDSSVLQDLWKDAYERLDNVSEDNKVSELMNLTANAGENYTLLEEYLKKNIDLKPEEKFFIEISIQVKKFKEKERELMSNSSEAFKNVE